VPHFCPGSSENHLYSASQAVLSLHTASTAQNHDAQLIDAVRQAVRSPLRIDFGPAAQREAVQTLVVPDVAKHRLNRADALQIQLSASRCVSCLLHQLDGGTSLLIGLEAAATARPCFPLDQ